MELKKTQKWTMGLWGKPLNLLWKMGHLWVPLDPEVNNRRLNLVLGAHHYFGSVLLNSQTKPNIVIVNKGQWNQVYYLKTLSLSLWFALTLFSFLIGLFLCFLVLCGTHAFDSVRWCSWLGSIALCLRLWLNILSNNAWVDFQKQ